LGAKGYLLPFCEEGLVDHSTLDNERILHKGKVEKRWERTGSKAKLRDLIFDVLRLASSKTGVRRRDRL